MLKETGGNNHVGEGSGCDVNRLSLSLYRKLILDLQQMLGLCTDFLKSSVAAGKIASLLVG